MAAKDIYHDNVRTALIKDGWTITDEPLILSAGKRGLQADLGAEKLLIAQRQSQKIAVEVKSFISPSPVRDFEQALGQYMLYLSIMRQSYPERKLYLAIRDFNFFQEEIVKITTQMQPLNILVFDDAQEKIVRWID